MKKDRNISILTGHIGRAIRRRAKVINQKRSFIHLRSLGMSRREAKQYSKVEVEREN